MKCPSCRKKTEIEITRKEYVYPKVILGLPAYWGFMSPAVAWVVTAAIALIGLGMAAIAVMWWLKGFWLPALAALLAVFITLYVIIVCAKSIGKYRIKNHYRCLSCRLEWAWFADDVRSGSSPAGRRSGRH
jgi:hypothetical protein